MSNKLSRRPIIGKSNNRHVVPGKNGGCDVKKPRSSKASAHAETQSQATSRAREIVGNAEGGEVRIHNRQGQICDSDTVAPGNDPNPPLDKK